MARAQGMDPAERARRKRVLNSAIRVREETVARWSTYILDPVLERALARMREELAQLRADRAALDRQDPGRIAEVTRLMLGEAARRGE